jgi:diguanylate cyclase (GGDEF)-like protein/PAS domain S-box-containing protein
MFRHTTWDRGRSPFAATVWWDVIARKLSWLLLGCIAFGAGAQSNRAVRHSIERHAEESRALTDPADVLIRLPAMLAAAQARADLRDQALLLLAKSNACRVLSKIPCQVAAGAEARRVARQAGDFHIEVRGYILEANGEMTRQNYPRAEELMIEADSILRQHPHALLLGDVLLTYSSISYALGDAARSEEHARRGLMSMGVRDEPAIRARLLRNQARALVELGRYAEAEQAVGNALRRLPENEDPRLRAQLHFEAARVAQRRENQATVRAHAQAALAIARGLDSAPLSGRAQELLGDAALASNDLVSAEVHFRAAADDFQTAQWPREERRALQQLISLQIDRGGDDSTAALTRRLIQLVSRLEKQDQTALAASFDARLAQAEEAYQGRMLRRSMEASEQRQTLLRWLIAAGTALSIVLAGAAIAQRHSKVRLTEALAHARDSKARYQALTDHMPAAIVELDRDLKFRQVNAWVAESVGMPAASLIGRSVREVRGDVLFAQWKPHLDAALEGRVVRCRVETTKDGQSQCLDSTFLPRRAVDGEVDGVYGLTFDVTELKQTQEALERLARIDGLTGVANRRHFDERIEAVLAHARRMKRSVALFAFDLDRFKAINDTLGHAAGDAVLREFVSRILSCVRKDDFLARLGGDEFALIVEEAQPETSKLIARKLLNCMKATMSVLDQEVQMSVSIGVAFGDGSTTADQLVGAADNALYAAKAAGRATYAIHHVGAAFPDAER